MRKIFYFTAIVLCGQIFQLCAAMQPKAQHSILQIIKGIEESEAEKSLLPFQLLLNPEYKNSIIICGVKVNQPSPKNTQRSQSELDLKLFTKQGIDAHYEELKEGKKPIIIFCNDTSNSRWRWEKDKSSYSNALLYRKNQRNRMVTQEIDYGRYEMRNKINNKTYVIYHVPLYDDQKHSFDDAYGKHLVSYSYETDKPCLVLVDNDILQRCDIIQKIYNRIYNGSKRIITCNPYSGTIEKYSPPGNNFLLYPLFIGLLAGCLAYCDSDHIMQCIDALQNGSILP